MNLIEKAKSLITGEGRPSEPVGTVHVVDPSPLNWLYITYNTVEELVRVDTQGKIRPAAMQRYRWVDACTLEIHVRKGERFPDGEPLTASSVKRSFDEHASPPSRTSATASSSASERRWRREAQGLERLPRRWMATDHLVAEHLRDARAW